MNVTLVRDSGVKMNYLKTIICLTFCLLIWGNLFAINKLYTDTRGFRHYSCGANMRGAHIAVKDLGKDRFRIKSSIYAGILHLPEETAESRWCTGLVGAVRVLCGLCKNPNAQNSLDDKVRRLGLNKPYE